jgi:ribosomal protein S18 acetylase RimI-like enzyme
MTVDAPLGIFTAEERHVESAWRIIDACRTALRERGIDQWDDVYPTRQTVADDAAHHRLFVLIAAEHCVATMALDDTQAPEYATVPWQFPTPALVVHRLCVHPMRQGQGFGRTLMDFAEAHAAEHCYASIRLDAYSPNLDAVALYRRRGYRDAGRVFFPRRTASFYCFERPVPPALGR